MSQAELSTSVKSFQPGEVIAEEGSTGGGWYVLLSGRVGVFKRGTRIAEFTNRGVVFGEISSILSRPRTARLVAEELTSVAYFEASVEDLVAKHPIVAKTVLISLAARLERTTEALWVAVQGQDELGAPAQPATPPAVSA
jgi:CRP-like cAMP-binding protein